MSPVQRLTFACLAVLGLSIASAALAASWFSGPSAESLHKQLPAAQTALEQAARSGSQADLDAALARLRNLSTRCKEIRSCDLLRFLAAYEQGLRVSAPKPLATIQADERLIGAKLPDMHTAMDELHGRQLRDLITLNEPVKAALDEWLTWNRTLLIESYKNYAYMRPLMAPAYQKADLPEALLFGILARESVGRVHSLSKSGAAGPLQFMPETGIRFGLTQKNGFDQRLDPKRAAQASVDYLREQLQKLDNDLALTLAAYNAGEGRVSRLYQTHKRGFFDAKMQAELPQETIDYVPRVLAAAYLFLHPEEFNLEFPKITGATVETDLPNAMSLSELSVCLGQSGREEGWFRTLRNLNPRWRPDQRAAAGSKVKIPEVALTNFRKTCADRSFMVRIASLHEARVPIPPGFKPYVIQKGDTLASIARKNTCTTIHTLADFNAIVAPTYAIKPGQRIKVPNCG
jgi:membrane-bound lytic murein transglycosylase D